MPRRLCPQVNYAQGGPKPGYSYWWCASGAALTLCLGSCTASNPLIPLPSDRQEKFLQCSST